MKDTGSGIPNLVKAAEDVFTGRKLTGKVGV
jgi:hypothetical protein